MLVEEAIVARLTRPEASTGPLVENRIFPDYRPDDSELPCIVYERKPGSEPDYNIDGTLDHVRATWKLQIYAAQDEKKAALEIAPAITRDLNRYAAAVDDTLTIHYMYVLDQYDAYDGITKTHKITVEMEAWYTQIEFAAMPQISPNRPRDTFRSGADPMTTLNSLTSTLKLVEQGSKGVAATTGYICGRFTTSNAQPAFEYIEAQDEHFCGLNTRPTSRKSVSQPSGFLVPFGGMGYLYPLTLGKALSGLGFAGTKTTATGVDTWVYKIAARSAAPWLSVLYGVGDGADRFERLLTDGRVETLRVDANVRGIQTAFAGYALDEKAAAGTETSTNEVDKMLLPSKGSATINLEGASFTAPFRGMRFMVSNPLDRREQDMFSFKRSDLPSTGLDAAGSLQGVDVTYALYKELNWGSAAGAGPIADPLTGDVSWKFESADEITAGTPWSVEVALPSVEFRMGQFQSRGRDLIRFDLAYMMIDNVADPITVTIKTNTPS